MRVGIELVRARQNEQHSQAPLVSAGGQGKKACACRQPDMKEGIQRGYQNRGPTK
jgi:hypothetical protein